MKKKACEIRSEAWKALGENGQYLRYVAAALLLGLVTMAACIPLVGILVFGVGKSGIAPFLAPGGSPEIGLFTDPSVMLPLLLSSFAFSLLVVYPIGYALWGDAAMAIAAMRRGITVGHAFSGWGHGWRMGWIMMVQMTYVSLWSLLLFVPGVVKAISYAMTKFVAIDHPDWSANRCIAESRRLMDGNKWRYFCLQLSFSGWVILVCVASNIPFAGSFVHWLFVPYYGAAKAAFYENLLDGDEPAPHEEAR